MADKLTFEQLKEQLEELQKEFGDTTIIGDFAKEIQDLNKAFEDMSVSAKAVGSELLTKRLSDLKDRMSDALAPAEQFDRQLRRTIQTLTGVTEKSDTLIGSFFDYVHASEDQNDHSQLLIQQPCFQFVIQCLNAP